jgi:PAS domain S-box-containing protein
MSAGAGTELVMAAIPTGDPTGLPPFKHIVDQVPEAIIFADAAGLIRVWNRGAEVLFGFSASEALGNSLDIIIAERFRRAHWDGFHAAMASGHTRHGAQVRTTRAVHKDGRKLYVELSFSVVVNEAGTVLGSAAVGRDGTARHLSDSALRTRLTDLEDKAKTGATCPVPESDSAPAAGSG